MTVPKSIAWFVAALLAAVWPTLAAAVDEIALDTELRLNADRGGDLVLSSSPSDTVTPDGSVFGPLADYLSAVTGLRIVYRPPRSWLGLRRDLETDTFDLFFGEPHVVGYLVNRHRHDVVLAVRTDSVYAVLVARDDHEIVQLSDLAGRSVCARAFPDLGTLSLAQLFPNPMRTPRLEVSGEASPSVHVINTGLCRATVIPLGDVRQPSDPPTRILYLTEPLPGAGLSVSRRVAPGVRELLRSALLSPRGRQAAAGLRARFGSSRLQPATSAVYRRAGELLEEIW